MVDCILSEQYFVAVVLLQMASMRKT